MQVAKDPSNCNRPENNISEFKQAPIQEKELWAPLQNFFLLSQKTNKEKNIKTNKAK